MCRPAGARVGSNRLGWLTMTKGRSGMRPRVTSDSAVGDLLQAPADVDGACLEALRGGPRHRTVERIVDLEAPGP